MNPQVDVYLLDGCGRCPLAATPQCKVHKWLAELKLLRDILINCGLTEELKWSQPCYMFNKRNILILSAFKQYCAINFFKGSLLNDTNKILVKPGENTQGGRQLRFTNIETIIEQEPIIKAYIFEAIEIEKAGLKVEPKKTSDFKIPDELQQKFEEIPALKLAFYTLTPGRQRGYLYYFSQAKQSKTRSTRIEKFIPHILNGKGLNDE